MARIRHIGCLATFLFRGQPVTGKGIGSDDAVRDACFFISQMNTGVDFRTDYF